jgi:metal-responsive CopG/Arc/MetJ family transcriptional regulator
MLTIEELLTRHKQVIVLPSGREFIWYRKTRLKLWAELLEARQQRLRKVPTLLNKLIKERRWMDDDEAELLESLIDEQHDVEANGNLSWTRISLHMDTLSQLDRAATRKGVSKSELAEIAIREYCKAIGIE